VGETAVFLGGVGSEENPLGFGDQKGLFESGKRKSDRVI